MFGRLGEISVGVPFKMAVPRYRANLDGVPKAVFAGASRKTPIFHKGRDMELTVPLDNMAGFLPSTEFLL